MLFMLLSLFFILSGAIETTSLQPVDEMEVPLGKMEVHNASAPDLKSVLASKGNPDVLLKMLENADPTKVGEILVLVRALLADLELDLETLTTAVTDANNAYDLAESAHSASIKAQTVGKAKLAQAVADATVVLADSKQAQTEGEVALALDVTNALAEKQTALGAKTTAQGELDVEKSRLVSEIDRLKEVIAVLTSLENDGYTLFFRQTAPTFKNKAGWLNTGSPSEPNFSMLETLDDSWKGADGKFQFQIRWPLQGSNSFNVWKQSSNPITKKSQGVDGYEAVTIHRAGCHWGGLEYCTSNVALLDGSVNHGNWHYAIGSSRTWGKGIPAGCDQGTTVTELYVLKPSADPVIMTPTAVTVLDPTGGDGNKITGWHKAPELINFGQEGLVGGWWKQMTLEFDYGSDISVRGVKCDYTQNLYSLKVSSDGTTWSSAGIPAGMAGDHMFSSNINLRYARVQWLKTGGSNGFHWALYH